MLNDINELMKTMNDEVPVLVRKRTDEIRELDKKVAKNLHEIRIKTYAHVKNLKIFNKEQKSKSYAELLKRLDEAEEYSEKKVQLARSMYDSVDDYIKKMDDTDKKFREQRAKTSKKLEESLANMPSPIKKDGKIRKDKKKSMGADIKASRMAETETFIKPIIPPLTENTEMPIDPNEPTYCFCHSVSFGQMVACDNKDCPTEWFHFSCVGLTESPPGTWYCDSCKSSMPKRKR